MFSVEREVDRERPLDMRGRAVAREIQALHGEPLRGVAAHPLRRGGFDAVVGEGGSGRVHAEHGRSGGAGHAHLPGDLAAERAQAGVDRGERGQVEGLHVEQEAEIDPRSPGMILPVERAHPFLERHSRTRRPGQRGPPGVTRPRRDLDSCA